ncbi:TKL-1 [Symbiodinium pilosum]|uniref:TKL-1 protein n=1 Tax=Symbiodinium pilosum TaxID=2952 RepID=A0A812S9K0_SYMPI|nr:TKL-1 [Symbiodinium pilosum]
MEGDLDEEEKAEADAKALAKAEASAAKPKEEKAKAKAPPKELEATAAAQIPSKEDEAPPADVNEAPPKAAPAPDAAAGAPAAPAAARGDDLLDELQALRRGVPEKEKKLEAELAELYAKAEEALKAGDEEAARKLLESKAKTQASLDSLREGQKRREAQQSEQLVSLEAQVKDLYERAEKSLAAGNETDARRYLQEREQALKKLADLKQTRET